ncbi:MAG: GGDEF domain-containing protein [Lysinibacillus sp.]
MDQQHFEELFITTQELFNTNRFLEYIELSDAAIEFAYELERYDKALLLLRYRCTSYFQIGNLRMAISVLGQYSELTFQYGTDIDIIQYYSLASICWATYGHLKKAEKLMLKGLEIAHRIEHAESLGKIYNNLSQLQRESGRYEQAKIFATKSLYYSNAFEKKHKYPFTGIIHPKTNLAVAHIWLAEYGEAEALIKELLVTITKPPYSKAQLEVFNAYALFFEKQNRIDEAIDMYQKSKRFALENNDLSLLQTIYASLLKLVEQQGDLIVQCAIQKEYISILLEIQKEDYSQVLFEMEYSGKKKQIEKTSYVDPLTSIYNRRYFDKHATKLLQDASNTKQRWALMMIDMDHFKSINDSYGHLFGDQALIAAASILQKFSQSYESIVARFGGDEFIVLTKINEDQSEQIIAYEIYQELTSLVLNTGQEAVNLEFSIGVSTNEDGRITDTGQLIKEADSALYISKRNGRNQLTIYNRHNNF